MHILSASRHIPQLHSWGSSLIVVVFFYVALADVSGSSLTVFLPQKCLHLILLIMDLICRWTNIIWKPLHKCYVDRLKMTKLCRIPSRESQCLSTWSSTKIVGKGKDARISQWICCCGSLTFFAAQGRSSNDRLRRRYLATRWGLSAKNLRQDNLRHS